jgi:hypothetical protein
MKKCSKCGIEKSFDCFHKNASNKDGYNFQCKECRKEGCALYFKKLDETTKIKRNSKKRQWADANKEKIKEYSKEYSKNNKSLRAYTQRKRDCAKKKRIPHWLTQQDFLHIKCLYQLAEMRTKETGYPWHVDHVIPLQGRTVSGLHVPTNLQVIPASENLRKYNTYGKD